MATTVLGATPSAPDIELEGPGQFPDGSGERDDAIASNAPAEDGIFEDLNKDDSEQGSLVCN